MYDMHIPYTGVTWQFQKGVTPEALGFIITWFTASSDKSAIEQANDGYMRTGGCPWSPFEGHNLEQTEDGEYQLVYPGDPPSRELARCDIRDERVILFEHAWVCIIKPGGSYEVARCD